MVEAGMLPHARAILACYRETRKTITLPVRGSCMWPLIRPGDRVEIRLVELGEIRRGDILAFWNDGGLTVHRVFRTSGAGGVRHFCQRGDAQRGWSWVDEDRVVGRVEAVHRGGRILRVTKGAWALLNPVLGFASLTWVVVCRPAARCRRALRGAGSASNPTAQAR